MRHHLVLQGVRNQLVMFGIFNWALAAICSENWGMVLHDRLRFAALLAWFVVWGKYPVIKRGDGKATISR